MLLQENLQVNKLVLKTGCVPRENCECSTALLYTFLDLQERKMPSGEEEIRGLSITFSQTTRHHSGIYTCSADNGFGFSANATIVLDVQRKWFFKKK